MRGAAQLAEVQISWVPLTDTAKEDCKTPSWKCPQPIRELKQASVTAPALFGDGFDSTGQAQDTKCWSPLPCPFSFPHTQTKHKLDTTYAVFAPSHSWGSSWWAVRSNGKHVPLGWNVTSRCNMHTSGMHWKSVNIAHSSSCSLSHWQNQI